jgi:hypothetical protein
MMNDVEKAKAAKAATEDELNAAFSAGIAFIEKKGQDGMKAQYEGILNNALTTVEGKTIAVYLGLKKTDLPDYFKADKTVSAEKKEEDMVARYANLLMTPQGIKGIMAGFYTIGSKLPIPDMQSDSIDKLQKLQSGEQDMEYVLMAFGNRATMTLMGAKEYLNMIAQNLGQLFSHPAAGPVLDGLGAFGIFDDVYEQVTSAVGKIQINPNVYGQISNSTGGVISKQQIKKMLDMDLDPKIVSGAMNYIFQGARNQSAYAS